MKCAIFGSVGCFPNGMKSFQIEVNETDKY